MNLGDPELELIDPTPNVHSLFVHFDSLFFSTKLASRAVVRWSKRMYSCAGICSYEGRSGICDIALSEPLLKLRPRKDLIETLLHEMIHAFLFVTNRDQDRDGHGPNFKAHMHRINKSAGLNITIYHDFHDEVKMYLTHWWRCNGTCQTKKPHFGIVRRSANRAPGPHDYWWNLHKSMCGGTFVKIKEPEKRQKSKAKTKVVKDPQADITKYIKTTKPIINEVVVFSGSGNLLTPSKITSISTDVIETVRSIWAAKQIPSTKEPVKKVDTSLFKKPIKNLGNDTIRAVNPKLGTVNPKKNKAESTSIQSPPSKMKKIDDYFNATTLLKDLYGNDYKLTQTNNGSKLIAVKVELVVCPVCSSQVNTEVINRHLDECLNKEVIEKLCNENQESVVEIIPGQIDVDRTNVVSVIPKVLASKDISDSINNNITDLTSYNIYNTNKPEANKSVNERRISLPSDIVIKSPADKIDEEKIKKEAETKSSANNLGKRRNTVSFITSERGDFLPSKIKEEVIVLEDATIKTEPGTSATEVFAQVCPCCGKKFDKPVEEHLDECLVFFNNDTTIPTQVPSTSYSNNTTIVIDDDDDIFDESQILNATGTKTPCPCCMEMVEQADMNDHLDLCLK